jgi:ligand-binding sensor domain-containing protein
MHIWFLPIPLTLKFMTSKFAGFLLLLAFPFCLYSQQPGSWQDHLPYMQAIAVSSTQEKIICATPFALFTVDLKDNTIERLSKVNGLSEVGIAAMETDENSGKTIVAYKNGNIDLVTASGIINLDQIKRSNIAPDKSFTDIFFHNEKAYVSAAFGIVVIDIVKNEIKETYVIGNNGRQVPVFNITADVTSIYAATTEGLKMADARQANLSDYRNWKNLTGSWSPETPVEVLSFRDIILFRKADSLFGIVGSESRLLYSTSFNIKAVSLSAGKLLIIETNTTGEARVVVMNPDGAVNNTYEQPGIIRLPMDAVIKDNQLWIADSLSGLVQAVGTNYKSYQPNSPHSISTGEMIYAEASLWVTSGTLRREFSNSFSRNGFSRYTNMQWQNYTPAEVTAIDSMYDLVSVAHHNKERSLWVGSLGGGLLRYKHDEQVQVFKQQSGISPSLYHPGQYRVTGLTFDTDDALWISNYGASEPLVVKKPDGSWRKFRPPFSLNNNAVAKIIIDDFNQKWIISPEGNGLMVFNHGLSIDNTGDDQWKLYKAGNGNGNLPDNNVLSIAKDKSGFIWVGTSRGIGIIQCAGQAFSTNACEAILPVVQQDNFAGYLFSNETVQDIEVDAANRKWIATANGAWLITAEGEKTIHHFTEENSPLFSNDVRNITIDPKTGDVYFATSSGICSFRGTAIEGGAANDLLTIYPNPVPPGYNGSIAIRGVVSNGIVKITEPDGRLVYQTRAQGGQALWNGRDYRGRQVSSGVYLVIVSDDSRQEKAAGKIVFISR